MLFLLHQFTGELERGADLGAGERILTLHFVKAHPARQAANDQRNWHPRATNDGLAVADSRVDDDLVVHGFDTTPDSVFDQRAISSSHAPWPRLSGADHSTG